MTSCHIAFILPLYLLASFSTFTLLACVTHKLYPFSAPASLFVLCLSLVSISSHPTCLTLLLESVTLYIFPCVTPFMYPCTVFFTVFTLPSLLMSLPSLPHSLSLMHSNRLCTHFVFVWFISLARLLITLFPCPPSLYPETLFVSPKPWWATMTKNIYIQTFHLYIHPFHINDSNFSLLLTSTVVVPYILPPFTWRPFRNFVEENCFRFSKPDLQYVYKYTCAFTLVILFTHPVVPLWLPSRSWTTSFLPPFTLPFLLYSLFAVSFASLSSFLPFFVYILSPFLFASFLLFPLTSIFLPLLECNRYTY